MSSVSWRRRSRVFEGVFVRTGEDIVVLEGVRGDKDQSMSEQSVVVEVAV